MPYSGMHKSMLRANARNAKQLLKEGQEPDGKPFTKARIKYLNSVVEEGTWVDDE